MRCLRTPHTACDAPCLQRYTLTICNVLCLSPLAARLAAGVQEMSARLGLVTGRDLAQTVRSGCPRWLNYVIYFNMEIAVIGADIQEVVGTGVAIYLMTNGAVSRAGSCGMSRTGSIRRDRTGRHGHSVLC